MSSQKSDEPVILRITFPSRMQLGTMASALRGTNDQSDWVEIERIHQLVLTQLKCLSADVKVEECEEDR